MSNFTHLHLHSHFSVLDGLGKIEQIVNKAVEQGALAVAITDHASISSMPELFRVAKEKGIKPVIGCEFYVVDDAEPDKSETRRHLTVWAKNWAGVQSILERLTLANRQFYKRPRLTFEQALKFENCMVGTGCSIGMLSADDYRQRIERLLAAYGRDLYLEVMPHTVAVDDDGMDIQRLCNNRALELWRDLGVKLVATNDAHYVDEEDAYTHEILLAVQSGKTWDDPKRWRFGSTAFFMRDRSQMYDAFVEQGVITGSTLLMALSATEEIVEKVDVQLPNFDVHLPSIHPDDEKALMEKVLAGWGRLVEGSGVDEVEYKKRLLYEIGVIRKLGFVRYFLIVEDIICWARGQGIMVGPARGSSAGSLVCYLMGITQIDPIRHELFFERFLNPERVDLPDIDTDFQDDRRGEVFEYIRTKYGVEKTGHINTFGILTLKSAFRDVARVFGISPLNVNVLSKQIEDVESFEKVPDLAKFTREHAQIVEQTKKLEGTIRQCGVHACGMIVSSHPIDEVAVLEKRKDVEAICWDKRECENFGLLKMDVLGLSTLTILNRAKKLIQKHRRVDIDFENIPLDDPATMEAFSKGEGVGVFQFENSGMCQLLKDLQADNFETITATTALYRPGSLNSGQTQAYVNIAKGDEYEHYSCEELKPILGETHGVLVYQEQIMRIFSDLAGFSWAGADKMRKIIGKKLGKDEFDKYRADFVAGCNVNGINEGVANDLFDKMAEFAAYSFNKSHAVAYSTISVWCMYLKTHYPAEYMAAQMCSASDERIPALVREVERLGLSVSRPDINASERKYALLDDKTIIPPLGAIKGVGKKAVDTIFEARADGVFLGVDDLRERVNRRACNIRVVETLKRAGAFESLGVREPDEEVRLKNFAELLPTFNRLPNLDKKGNLDKEALKPVLYEGMACARDKGRKYMMPKFSKNPAIMVINNPVKGEREHLLNEGTQYFLKKVKEFGFKQQDFYYTGPVKCFVKKGKTVTKECEGRCFDLLREEIKAVQPKLILCCASNVLSMFANGKPSMGKLHGEVVFNKEFNAYVLFSFSPQYAYFKEEIAPKFYEAMTTLGDIFA